MSEFDEAVKRTGNDQMLAMALIREHREGTVALRAPVCLAAGDWLVINDPDEATITQRHFTPKFNAIGHTAMARHGQTLEEAMFDPALNWMDIGGMKP